MARSGFVRLGKMEEGELMKTTFLMEKITLRAAKQAATKRECARVYSDMNPPRDIRIEHDGNIYARRAWQSGDSVIWEKWKLMKTRAYWLSADQREDYAMGTYATPEEAKKAEDGIWKELLSHPGDEKRRADILAGSIIFCEAASE